LSVVQSTGPDVRLSTSRSFEVNPRRPEKDILNHLLELDR
jgi:hypothetical protein